MTSHVENSDHLLASLLSRRVATGADQNADAEPWLTNAGVTVSSTTPVTVPVQEQRGRPVKYVLSFAVLLVAATLAVLVIWITAGNGRVQASSSVRPPHIVLILADDLGWADLSYNGNPQIRTPNIDALAWNGVRLSRLYYQPLCTPSRAAIMTGLYPIHTGMQHFVINMSEPRGLPLNLKLLPEWLNDLGYTSYMLGKWHLGFHESAYTPTNRGFLSHVGSWGGACEYTTHQRAAPMFLYVAHLAPHYGTVRVPLEAPVEYHEGYDFIGPRNRTIYAGMVSALDKSVGEIFEALHEKGMLNDTFLSFSSDNGAAATFWGTDGASSYPLRGEKSTLWEGGVRVPGFIWTAEPLWRGRGSHYDRIFHATDWLPTLYELAGGNLSKLAGIDGVSHLRSIGDPLTYPPRSEVLLNIDSHRGQ
ncbi:hypothetical protein MTO96_024781 [Rhipicephalus appendiculatus]